jgi:hypothetical protein
MTRSKRIDRKPVPHGPKPAPEIRNLRRGGRPRRPATLEPVQRLRAGVQIFTLNGPPCRLNVD